MHFDKRTAISRIQMYAYKTIPAVKCLEETLKQLETRKTTGVKSLLLVIKAVYNIEQVQGPSGMAVKEKT